MRIFEYEYKADKNGHVTHALWQIKRYDDETPFRVKKNGDILNSVFCNAYGLDYVEICIRNPYTCAESHLGFWNDEHIYLDWYLKNCMYDIVLKVKCHPLSSVKITEHFQDFQVLNMEGIIPTTSYHLQENEQSCWKRFCCCG